MEPNWVRPAYLRLMCLVGIVVMAYGLLGFVLGFSFRHLRRSPESIRLIRRVLFLNVASPINVASYIVWMQRCRLATCAALHDGERQRKNREHCDRRCAQSANYCAAQWRCLFTTFTERKGHRDHAGDHGDACHQDWSQPITCASDCCFFC